MTGINKIVCVSDTHAKHRELEIPKCDLLICAGDMSFRGEPKIIRDFDEWAKELKAAGTIRHAVTIAGNHELTFENDPTLAPAWLKNWIYLLDSHVTLEGLKIYGSPWQPVFFDWAYNLPRNGAELAARWAAIPDDTDILITHGPPFGILDRTIRGPAGCERLAARVSELVNLKLHVFGHLHSGYGKRLIGNTVFVNAASCNEAYQATNAPILLEEN